MDTAVLDEETRLKKLVKDYFGDFVTARKTIEGLEQTLQDQTYFTKDFRLVAEEVFPKWICNFVQNIDLSMEKAEHMIAPLQEHREV